MPSTNAKWIKTEGQRKHLELVRTAPGMTKAEGMIDVARGLLAMQKAGLVRSLYIDQSKIRLALPDYPAHMRAVSWELARAMVERFRAECRVNNSLQR